MADRFPALTVVGPRQSGKTTLCRHLFAHLPYRSLESPDVRARATEDPRLFLDSMPDGAVIDEVQRVPAIMSYLQEYIDRDLRPGRWILTGSQNFALVESVSQSLAGRTAICHLLPLAWSEVRRAPSHPKTLGELLLRGGFPQLHAAAERDDGRTGRQGARTRSVTPPLRGSSDLTPRAPAPPPSVPALAAGARSPRAPHRPRPGGRSRTGPRP